MKFLGKKQLMTVALVAALGVAVYLNYYLTQDPALSAGTDTSDTRDEEHLGDATFVGAGVSKPEGEQGDTSREEADYFDTARANRTAAREEALSILQEVLDNAQATAEDKAAATAKASAIAENVLKESNIESLITAKGFPDSVVYISGDSCSVVVAAKELQQQESLQILQLVVSQTEISAAKVQIVAAEA